MLGSSGNFYLRKFPAFPESQATVAAFKPSCSLWHTAACGFWYFPLMISVCYRLLESALWLVGGVGQMLPGLSINWLQQQQTGFNCPFDPSQSLAPTNPVGFGLDTLPAQPSALQQMGRARFFTGVPVHPPAPFCAACCPLCPRAGQLARWLTQFSSARSNILFLRSHWLL